ncbi:MAG: XdhC/CoxI family protein, partial [SAR116 cluster bacterium MED-G04]
MFIANDHILERAARWQDEGHRLALAVVIRTWGSSPRPLGSLMVIRGDGQIEGSVSGGCVEGAVIDSGMRRIEDGSTERLDFGVA